MAYTGHPGDPASRKIKASQFWIDFSQRFWVQELYVRHTDRNREVCAVVGEAKFPERGEGYRRIVRRDVWMTIAKDGVEWAKFPRERDERRQRRR